jgi:EAL domain-containing protein (putative c-di-GMP-specific phosphodiesterase class I)
MSALAKSTASLIRRPSVEAGCVGAREFLHAQRSHSDRDELTGQLNRIRLTDALDAILARASVRTKRSEAFVAYEPASATETSRFRNRAMADSVMQALDEHRMHLVLQPIVHARTGRPALYECLLRMERPDGTLVVAREFIPIAEQLGLSRLVDRRVLELAVDMMKRCPDLKLAVNVSALTCSDHEWLATLKRLTGARRELLERLTVEITETAALQDIDQSVCFVDKLKEFGCRVAIDDFDAGYTSFKNLKLLNVDIIKIDGSFVKDLSDNPSDQAFIKTMIELAQTCGMETVAEWVGDARAVRHLVAAGITYLQGAYYSMPVKAADYAPAA